MILFPSALADRIPQLAPPEEYVFAFSQLNIRSIDQSTVVPPVTASPAKKPGAATTTFAHDAGNGVAPPKAPVALVNSTKMSPLLANSTKAGNPAVIDDKLAKCKARAECFGILLAEPKQPPQRQEKKVSKRSGPVSDHAEKLKKRTERFGSTNMPTQAVKSGSKRPPLQGRSTRKNSSGDGNALSVSELKLDLPIVGLFSR